MASIRERPATGKHKGKKPPTYAVLYRRDDGTQTSLTVEDEKLAGKVKRWIEADGEDVALERLRAHVNRGTGVTVDELVTRYLEWKASRVRSDRTIADYERDHRNHIKPFLGTRVAGDQTTDDIQDWLDALANRRSAKTAMNVYGSVLAPAYKWGATKARPRLVKSNPCEGVDTPALRKTPPKGLRPGEWPILHRAATDTYPDVADLLLFLIGTGWRIGEAMALDVWQVETVSDADGPVVSVAMGQVVRRNAANRFEIVDDAKSDAGRRVLRLSPAVGDMVLRRIKGKADDAPVFTEPTGTRWRYSHFYDRYWTRVKDRGRRDERPRVLERAKTLGLKRADQITPHWLRHTNVAMLIRAGGKLPEVQRRIGHEHHNTTIDVYGRGIDDTSPEVLTALDTELLGKPRLRAVE